MDLNIDVEELMLAGDDSTWSMDDWSWDPKAMVATPAVGIVDAGSLRAGKRPCLGPRLGPAGQWTNVVQACQAPCCGGGALAPCTSPEGSSDRSDSLQERRSVKLSDTAEVTKPGSLPTCQVEECGRDISHLSTYYQRCRICEIHIKEPQFLRHGRLQRFCQQCGRCHELSAFQGSKRSCREQLAKHNARRRRRSDKSTAAVEVPNHKVAAAGASPCQARLSSAIAALDAIGVPHASVGTPDQVAPATVGFPAEAAQYVPVSFPAASLAQMAPACGDALSLDTLTTTGSPDALSARGFDAGSQAQGASLDARTTADESVAVGIPVPSDQLTAQDQAHLFNSSFETARALLSSEPPGRPAGYRGDNLVMRLSIKLFSCTPAELPADLQQQLTGWLKCTPAGAEGYLRPGCVHLVLQAHVPSAFGSQISEDGLRALVEHLRSQGHPVWRDKVALFDLNGRLALAKSGRLVSSWDLTQTPLEPVGYAASSSGEPTGSAGARGAPVISAVTPSVVVSGQEEFVCVEMAAGSDDCKLLCRSRGAYHTLKCAWPAIADTEPEASKRAVSVRLPRGIAPGLAWLEIHRGCMLSPAAPVLVAPSASLADELRAWAASAEPGAHNELLMDVGLLLGERGCAGASERLQTTVSRVAEFAAAADLPRLLEWLLESYPTCTAFSQPAAGETSVLHTCVRNGCHQALAVLLDHGGLQADHPGPQGLTPLHLAAVRGGTSGRASAELLLRALGGQAAWQDSLAEDGLSPSDLAKLAGFNDMDAWLKATANDQADEPEALLAASERQETSLNVTVLQGTLDGSTECVIDIPASEQLAALESSAEGEPLLAAGFATGVQHCATWPGPLAGLGMQGALGRCSNATLLGVVACVCTCVMLLRTWV